MTPPRGTIVPDMHALRPRGLFAPRWLALGALAAGLVFTLQQGTYSHHAPAPLQAVPLSVAVKALPPKPVIAPAPVVPHSTAPSVFEQEAAMQPSALMARWEPLILQASPNSMSPEWIRAVMRQESGGRTMLAENLPSSPRPARWHHASDARHLYGNGGAIWLGRRPL